MKDIFQLTIIFLLFFLIISFLMKFASRIGETIRTFLIELWNSIRGN
ncbi:hypothetical protein [Anaerobranca gottschalkii]|uniref:Uncharacterized protein n=1 Tax=Anaerobranca gottschalkii DSM 13577 TaxID=1120990 RepID=A0A1I0C7M7_9FIRM|nr:hypothetical protein [Anaerobranca gottschalkii]SET15087.1 hypothetical protein SAMN03080614_10612 [Anaerobranca gottschalkii DSM 13577]